VEIPLFLFHFKIKVFSIFLQSNTAIDIGKNRK